MERKYKAFISYRHAELDSAVAKSLHTLIEQYRIPKSLRTGGEKKLGIVFRDEEELSATNDLTDKIYTALDNSEHLVVICTKATLQSPWVTKEVEHFLKKHERDKAHIILADGEPMEVFPRPLTHTEYENGMVEVTEPMAVDVRAENIPAVKKKLKTQILRLFAAMLGCPYDALAMREQKRKRRRFTAVMSMILAVAIGFSTVLLVKNRQIDRKNAELDSANIALEAKNEELEEKNAQVLLRESELLTANSAEAYREGNNYSAIYNAAMALPAKDDSRPYYAPAEAALLTALSPFDDDTGYIMRDTVLEQSTPVENFRISADGSKIATIDLYSVVTIFDTVTGEVLNTIQLNTNTVYLSFTNVHLMYCPEADCVIAFDGTTIAAISFETCDIMWTRSTPYAQTDFICPSGDGSVFAYVRSVFNEEDQCTDYELVFLSGKTGEIINTSTFIDSSLYNKDNYKRTAFKGFVASGMYNGRFSSDNSRFITSFFSKNDDDVYSIHYSLTDISTGTSEVFCSFEVDNYYTSESVYFLFFDTEDSVVSVRQNTESGYVLQAERMDIESGSVIWHLDIPKAALFTSIEENDSIFCFTSGVTGTTTYVILTDAVYIFDSFTGELVGTHKLPGKVMDADLSNGDFVYVLENGHYSTAILSAYGISDIGDSVDLGDTLRMRLWNGGPTALNGSDDYSDAGYIATVPAGNPHSVIIMRLDIIEDLLSTEGTELYTDGYFSPNHPMHTKDGSLVLGPFYKDGSNYFKLINPDTGEFIKELPIESSFGTSDMLVLPDGSGIVYTDEYGNISLYKDDGTTEVLYETEYTFVTFADTIVCDIPALSASAVISETKDVLSAVCTEDTLILWTNGENKRELPLPEDLNWIFSNENSVTFMMEIASDGSIFISDFTNDDYYIDRFAVYSIVSGKWSYIELGETPLAAGSLHFSDSSSTFILMDDDGLVHKYDTAGNVYSSFPLQLPANSVYQLELILDDAYILVKTTDLQVLIYDSTTGEIVYNETDVSLTSTLLYAYHDSANNRLYLATESTSTLCAGLCIDIGSWTTLAEINGFVYFNEDTSEIYRVALLEDSNETGIITQFLPPADELTSLTREFLGV